MRLVDVAAGVLVGELADFLAVYGLDVGEAGIRQTIDVFRGPSGFVFWLKAFLSPVVIHVFFVGLVSIVIVVIFWIRVLRRGGLRITLRARDRGANRFRRVGLLGSGNLFGRRRGLLVSSLLDRKSTRLNSSHRCISYAVFCL